MTSESKTECTIAICHSQKIKATLYEILERMKCRICEISSLDDLLAFAQSSEFSHFDLTDTSDMEPFALASDNLLLSGAETGIPFSTVEHADTQKKRRPDDTTLYKSNYLTLAEIEKLYIERTLAVCGGRCTSAAKLLGIDRTTLYRKIKTYGITRTKLPG